MIEHKRVPHSLIDLDALETVGWTTFLVSSNLRHVIAEQLISIASSLGVPIATRPGSAVIDVLTPMTCAAAKPKSLSALHSVEEFPLHTDAAHWVIPCRYIMLGCLSPGRGARRTTLLDTNRLQLTRDQRSLLRREPIRVVSGRTSFFSTIYARNRPFVRFDPGCMKSVFPEGARALELLSARHWQPNVESIDWEQGKVLIVDNWRVLHGRGRARVQDHDRTLLRISIR